MKAEGGTTRTRSRRGMAAGLPLAVIVGIGFARFAYPPLLPLAGRARLGERGAGRLAGAANLAG